MGVRAERAKKGARVASYGLGGSIAGMTAGYYAGGGKGLPWGPINSKQQKTVMVGRRVGMTAGLAFGASREAKRDRANQGVPSVDTGKTSATHQLRVGTKTNGRVARGKHPYMV